MNTSKPAAALLFNALVWGLSWWPMRQIQALGLHPLWTILFTLLIALAVISLIQPNGWRGLLSNRALWLIALCAGGTNACFNWAVAIGDVVRVVLLFYLMPLWSVFLGRFLLHEALSPMAFVRVGLAIAGAMLVLGWRQAGAAPLGLADGLAIAGGVFFALNNVMLRQQARCSEAARTLAMVVGGIVVSMPLALLLSARGLIPSLPTVSVLLVLAVVVSGLVILGANLALQYGAGRLRAQVTAMIMLFEVPVAALSSWVMGSGRLDAQVLAGGACILSATLLAIWKP